MNASKTSFFALPSFLLLIGAASDLAAEGIGSGPSVGSDYDLVAFHEATGDQAVYIAWRDARSDVASGVLHLDDGTFDAFPTLASSYVSNIGVGAGGPAEARRAYATWGDPQLRLRLAVFDREGQIVSPPQDVTNSVQIAPNRLVGTDAGVLVGHAWDTEPYWDPRILEVDVSGNVIGLTVAADVSSPEQTLGTTLAGEPDGSHLVAYVTSDAHLVRLRRYDPTGPLDHSAVVLSTDAAGDYLPRSTIFSQDRPSRVLLAFPYDPTGTGPDVRFAVAPLSTDPVTVGPVLSDFVPGFVGQVSDMVALAGTSPRCVVVWQEVEYEDLETCLCTVPPRVRVEFFALVLAVGQSITAEGEPVLVHRWITGNPIGPPITEPRVVASDTPGSYTVLWSDGVLRYVQVDGLTVGVTESGMRPPLTSLSVNPNPFTRTTTITYSSPQGSSALLTILDVRGRVVARLSDGRQGLATRLVPWDGADSDGRPLPAGMYFLRLEAAGEIETMKLVVSR